MPIFSELLLRTESDTMEIFTLTPNFPAHVWRTRSSFSIKNTTHKLFYVVSSDFYILDVMSFLSTPLLDRMYTMLKSVTIVLLFNIFII